METNINEMYMETETPEMELEETEVSGTEEATEEFIETVSSGDAVATVGIDYNARFDEIVLLLEEQGEQIYTLQETQEQTLWDKPIEEYTPTEGLLLIMMFIMLFVLIYELVGGIIICKR